MSNLCVHHNDLDGICSAAIVNHFVPDCEFHSINYGLSIPWKKIKNADKVYMVDFGLQPFTEMLKLYDLKRDKFIWIDHHVTAINDYKQSGQSFVGLRRIGNAGCELTWEWFTGKTTLPRAVQMLGRYDVWDTNFHEELIPFYYGMTLENMHPTDPRWEYMFDEESYGTDTYKNILEQGKIVHRYQVSRYCTFADQNRFEIEWKGCRFLCANAMLVSSMLFDGYYDENKHDAMMAFGWTGKTWTVSMYTCKDGIDVGVIAKSMGGGGHKGASGFQCDELPFKLVGKGE